MCIACGDIRVILSQHMRRSTPWGTDVLAFAAQDAKGLEEFRRASMAMQGAPFVIVHSWLYVSKAFAQCNASSDSGQI
jgi:hypothetical protein